MPASRLRRLRQQAQPLSLVMCEVDHFKRVDDTHGHSTGDAVLRAIAVRLSATLRTSDVASRFGGEEFAMILPGVDATGAAAAAERIRAGIEATPIDTGTLSLLVTAGLGYADSDSFANEPELTPAQLIERADAALYAAKRAGRNRVGRAERRTQAG